MEDYSNYLIYLYLKHLLLDLLLKHQTISILLHLKYMVLFLLLYYSIDLPELTSISLGRGSFHYSESTVISSMMNGSDCNI